MPYVEPLWSQFPAKYLSAVDVGSILCKKLWPKSEFTNSLKTERLNILPHCKFECG